MPERQVSVLTSIDGGRLRFHYLEGREELGLPYRYDLEVLSERQDLALLDVLGKGVSVKVPLLDGSPRYLHGLVAHAEYRGTEGPHARYGLQLVPWLWFLARRRNCRIFQGDTTPQIVEKVLEDWPIADIELRLEGSYRPREYCVQYRESDLHFVTRLLEDEGITFFFRHREDGHTLVLIDGPGPCVPTVGYETIPYFPPREQARRERDHVDLWQASASVRAGKTTLRDFDFEKPRTDLTAGEADPRPHPLSAAEIYDYPGNYVELLAGDALARLRLEEELAGHARALGEGNARGIACGSRFELSGYPRESENRTWLVLATDITLTSEAYRSTMRQEGREPFRCRFEAQDIAVPYRPPRRTPRPFVHGPQTAIVTGPPGEEIHCDKYGRVRVRFHWDRSGRNDHSSSCWLRVSQAWAGAGWGAMHVPRIGQEVIVDFLEGDPDRPIVTGRVYNALCMPPWSLPDNATQSGIKSDSSKGGGGSNELRFEDKKGSEQVWLHAERNEDIVVENDKTELVKHDETLAVGNDRTRSVGGNETVSVDGEQKVTVGKSRTDTVKSSEKRTVFVAQKQKVGGLRSVQVGAAQSHFIGAYDAWRVIGGRTVKIGRGLKVEVGKERTTKIGQDDTLHVGGGRTGKIAKDDVLQVNGNRATEVAKDRSTQIGGGDTLKITKGLLIDAGEQVVIKTGLAAITMKKDGTITITGKDVTIDASGKITLKASGNVIVKGQKIEQN